VSEGRLGTADYPLTEKRPELVAGRRGKRLDELTIEAIVTGEVEMADIAITPQALRQQAEIARAAGRPTLAENFERAAELADVPQEVIMRIYELLRPGRAGSRASLVDAARELREVHGAKRMAAFVEEAAEVYERRGLFTSRY
jgi:propanediol dehydratase small subunit